MQQGFFRLLVAVFILFLVPIFLNSFIAYANASEGCAYGDDLVAQPILSDHPSCLTVRTSSGCLENIKLIIQSRCDEVFTYEQEDVVLELYKYEDWLKTNPKNPRAEFEIVERLTPEDLNDWSKEIGYQDDPNKKISVQVKIEPRQPKAFYRKLLKIILTILVVVSVIGLTNFFVVKFLNMLRNKFAKKRKNVSKMPHKRK